MGTDNGFVACAASTNAYIAWINAGVALVGFLRKKKRQIWFQVIYLL